MYQFIVTTAMSGPVSGMSSIVVSYAELEEAENAIKQIPQGGTRGIYYMVQRLYDPSEPRQQQLPFWLDTAVRESGWRESPTVGAPHRVVHPSGEEASDIRQALLRSIKQRYSFADFERNLEGDKQ